MLLCMLSKKLKRTPISQLSVRYAHEFPLHMYDKYFYIVDIICCRAASYHRNVILRITRLWYIIVMEFRE